MSDQWAVTCEGMSELMATRLAGVKKPYMTDRKHKAVRIPPPSEIEANARDAARLDWIIETQAEMLFGLVKNKISKQDARAAIDAAMGGDA